MMETWNVMDLWNLLEEEQKTKRNAKKHRNKEEMHDNNQEVMCLVCSETKLCL